MTQAVGHIAPISQESNLTRRAALTGMALLAAPTTAGAVCVFPGSDGPDAELIEIGRRLVDLSAKARNAWAEWSEVEYPMRAAVIEYEKTLKDLPREVRSGMLKSFIDRQHTESPEVDRLYNIANGLSDQLNEVEREAYRHKPTTIAGFAVYAFIIKINLPRVWDTPVKDMDYDDELTYRLAEALINHPDAPQTLA